MSAKQYQALRRLQRRGWEVHEICDRLHVAEDDVVQALAMIRTKRPELTKWPFCTPPLSTKDSKSLYYGLRWSKIHLWYSELIDD